MNCQNEIAVSSSARGMSGAGGVVLDGEGVRSIRHCLHELANVFTGVMIAGGLLEQSLEAGALRQYAVDITESSERGSNLVREIRNHLLGNCTEANAVSGGEVEEWKQGQ
jgi:hypothetical protein